MDEYIIIKRNFGDYDGLILCLTFESLLTYVQNIKFPLSKNKNEEMILIDQLLITGNGANRFLCCTLKNGKLDLRTAHIVNPSEYYRKKTVEFLHDNFCYVENSILTETQRQKIKEKIVF